MPDLSSLAQLDDKVLELVVEDGETRLASQFGLMQATTGSAFTVAGFAIAGATAALGAALAAARAAPPDWGVGAIAGGFALVEGIAAALAIDTARPRPKHIPGNEPGEWAKDSGPMTYKEALIQKAQVLQTMLDVNDAAIESASRRLRWSLRVGAAGVVLGLVAIPMLVV
ncbi:MAG TPA: hypothetical protein VGB08_00205 [Allosphingosinicella sp.]